MTIRGSPRVYDQFDLRRVVRLRTSFENEMMKVTSPVLRDGEEIAVHANGGDWLVAWHSPNAAPEGTPHGANAFCMTANDCVVLISNDGERWGWPESKAEDITLEL